MIDVVILTKDEEKNLPQCLRSLTQWAQSVHVVDSGSSDETVKIAEAHGARVVTHDFVTHAQQWTWALENLPATSDWVLALDADQSVTAELAESIARFVQHPGRYVGAYMSRRQIFRGTWIRFGGYYPKYLLKLFHRRFVSVDLSELVDHHFHVSGPTIKLNGDLIEENRNEDEIHTWIEKHNRYARLQAAFELRGSAGKKGRFFGAPDERITLYKNVWSAMPLYVRPILFFIYRYVVRGGFLDGKNGFLFHFLQTWWYRTLVDMNVEELRRRGNR